MRTIEVKKGKFGWQFRTDPNSGWSYFSDGIETKEQMLSYFTKGRMNAPQLVFVNDQNQRSKFYKVLKRDSGSVMLKVDHEKLLQLETEQFVPIAEQIDLLKIHADYSTKQEAEELSDQIQVLNLLKTKAGPQAQDALANKIQRTVTDEKIKELCIDHAKKYYGLPAQIDF
jgi:hypothetical protein